MYIGAGAAHAQQSPGFFIKSDETMTEKAISHPAGSQSSGSISNTPSNSTSNGPIYVIAGLDYSTSKAVADSNKLFEDTDYFVQLFFDWDQAFEQDWLNMGFSMDFRKAFVSTNSVSTNNVSASDLIKADTIGITISPRVDLNQLFFDKEGKGWKSDYFLRADLGGIIAQDSNSNVDESFKVESAVVMGMERPFGKNNYFRAELGAAYYERLVEDRFRSLVRMTYRYQIKQHNEDSGCVFASLEFNGVDHKDNVEARMQLGYQVDPQLLFKGIGVLLGK